MRNRTSAPASPQLAASSRLPGSRAVKRGGAPEDTLSSE